METFLQAILIGVVEGLTEFLPISSTGHMILLIDLLGFKAPPGKVFEIVIQLGAILAVCVLYWRRLAYAAIGMFRPGPDRAFVLNIIAAFLPAMALGALLHGFIKGALFQPFVVVISLALGGLAIIAIEHLSHRSHFQAVEEFPLPLCIKVGFFQCLAMIPGVSRSGATIMGSLLMGVDRKTAAEFSFFLAIPTMFAATAYDLYKNWHVMESGTNVAVIVAGFVSAFVTALLVVRALIGFISRHGFVPFAVYRILLAFVMMVALVVRS